MSDYEPDKPYVYQPFGMRNVDHWERGRIYAVSGLHFLAKIEGLTKVEAEAVRDALIEVARKK
jgi:hypothetical protein